MNQISDHIQRLLQDPEFQKILAAESAAEQAYELEAAFGLGAKVVKFFPDPIPEPPF